MHFYRIFILFILYYTSVTLSFAQQWLGVNGSNYAGTNAIFNNPANVVDTRYSVFVNLIGADAFMSNNYIQWSGPYNYLALITNIAPDKYRNPTTHNLIYRDEYLEANTSENLKHIYTLVEARGPAALVTLNNKSAIALSTRVRTGLSFTGIPPVLANMILNGVQTASSVVGNNYVLPTTTFNLNSFGEITASYGRVLISDEDRFVKVGVNIKRLIGLYSSSFQIGENADFLLKQDPLDPTKSIIDINRLNLLYNYTDDGAYKNAKPNFEWMTGQASAGSGWGMDLGIVYEFRPEARKYSYRKKGVLTLDNSKNKYQFKLGASLIDIGGLRYNNAFYNHSYNISVTGKTINTADFERMKGLQSTFDKVNSTLGVLPSQDTHDFSVALPTTLQLNADYHWKNYYYVNALWIQNLRTSESLGMQTPSLLAVTPRYERKWFEVAMPLALLDNYSVLAFGLSLRVGSVFIGSDNLGSLLNIAKPKGTDLYFGASIPVFRKPPTTPNACWYEQQNKKTLKEKLQFWKR